MASACVSVGACDIVQALVGTLMIVIPDEGGNLRFEFSGLEVIREQNAVLDRLMPTLDLALRLRVIRHAACVGQAFFFQIVSQIPGDIARAVV